MDEFENPDMDNHLDRISESASSQDIFTQAPVKVPPLLSVYDASTAFAWVCGVLIVAMLGVLTFSLIAYASIGVWQMLTIAGVSLLVSVSLGINFYWGRHSAAEKQAAGPVLVLLVVELLSIHLVLDGLDLILVVGGIVIVLTVGWLLFRRRVAQSLIAAGTLAGGVVLIRLVPPVARYSVTVDPSVLTILILIFALLLLVLSFVAIRAVRSTKIRTRILLTFALVSLLPGMLIAGTSFIFGYRENRARAFFETRTAASVCEDVIYAWVNDLSDDLELFLSLEETTLQDLLSSAPDDQNYQEAYDAEAARLSIIESFEVLLVVDSEERVIFSTDERAGQTPDLGDTDYFEQGMQGVYIGPIVHSGVLDAPVVTVALPIQSDTGDAQGVLVGQAGLASVLEILSDRTGISQVVQTYIIDDTGQLLTRLPDMGDHPLVMRSEAIDTLLASHKPLEGEYTNYAGDAVIGIYRWLPSLQVGLVTEVDASTLANTALLMLSVIVLISVCSIFIAIAVAVDVTRNITQPLAIVALTTTEIADGNLEVTLPVESSDEIGQLAAAVNQMAQRLRALVGGLEERVAARTADLARRSAQLETAARVARETASIRDTHQLLHMAVNQIAKQFGLYHVGLYLVDATSRTVVLRASSPGGGESLLAKGFRLDIGARGVIADTARTGDLNVVRDVDSDLRYTAHPELPDSLSEMSLPLRIRDEVVGVLDVQSEQPGFFTREDATYLQTMVDQIGLALENATLFEQTEARLQEIGRLVAVQEHAGWQRLASSRPHWAYVYDGLETRPLSDTAVDVDMPDLVLPLGGVERRLGTIKIRRRSDRDLTSEQTALAQAITKEAGLALERARLFSDTQEALVEIGVLYRSSRAIIDAETPQAILRAIADNAATPELDRLLLIVPEALTADGQVPMRTAAVLGDDASAFELVGRVWPEAALQVLGRAREGHLVLEDVASDASLDEASRQVLLHEMGILSALVMPLHAGQHVVGWLVVGATGQLYAFSTQEQRLYRGLADLSAAVVRNFQLLDLATSRVERSQALGVISSRMRETLDMDLILQTALREIGEALGISNIEVRMHGSRH